MNDAPVKVIGLKEHERAAPAIKRVKALAGLGGFLVAAFMGFAHGTPFAQAAERALLVGIVCNLGAWAVSVVVWKRVLVAEAGATAARLQAMREAATEESK